MLLCRCHACCSASANTYVATETCNAAVFCRPSRGSEDKYLGRYALLLAPETALISPTNIRESLGSLINVSRAGTTERPEIVDHPI